MKYLTATVLFLFAVACAAHADVLSDRTALNSILGSHAVTEDFESFSIDDGSAVSDTDISSLNSSAIFYGQGPGLVADGADYFGEGGIQWNGKDYYGQSSKDILSYGSNLVIEFWNPTPAFGFDLSIFEEFDDAYPDNATIDVYGADKTSLLYSLSDFYLSSASPVFWGFSDSNGIGKVVLTGNENGWGIITDNLSFAGSTAPEPVSTTLFLLGGATLAVRRLRSKK